MGKGVRHGVCSADIGGVAGQEHTGVEREQGARVPRRKEPSSKGSSLRPRPLPQERRAVVVRGGGGGLQGLWVREVRGGRAVPGTWFHSFIWGCTEGQAEERRGPLGSGRRWVGTP